MMYSIVIRSILFIVLAMACTGFGFAIPAANPEPEAEVAGLEFAVENFLKELETRDTSVNLAKRVLERPTCTRPFTPNFYAHRSVVLSKGVPAIKALGKLAPNLILRSGEVCRGLWCKNYATHRSSIVFCGHPGIVVPFSVIASSVQKIAETCRQGGWKTYGRVWDKTAGFYTEVNGAGCK
ncbi:hypothetical protein TWF718_010176 [Orbilia javanica]|uniref:Uncharacterized protein n=1 Tax=Orbilia javanica TaxID=47235 RepID=A0AAN8MX68_9PEZI